ncbi:MAG: isocitrate lyase/PEP mutase family protein [Pseudomonadota bacterium]
MSQAAALRMRLRQTPILVAPGIYDAFSAWRAEQAGFEAVFVSGSALAATHLGRPDIGLLTVSETADIVARIADRVSIPLFVDADQGFGNAHMVARSVRMLERAGASAIQIEDQQEVKPADAALSRPLVSTEVMVDKIRSARDALTDVQTMISARSDAMSTEGLEKALDRAQAYVEAGADMIFIESLTTRGEMERLTDSFAGRIPLLHNLLRPDDEVTTAAEAEALGYSVALFPGVAVGAVGTALEDRFVQLMQEPALPDAKALVDPVGAKDF